MEVSYRTPAETSSEGCRQHPRQAVLRIGAGKAASLAGWSRPTLYPHQQAHYRSHYGVV
jgi:hypothetical protein